MQESFRFSLRYSGIVPYPAFWDQTDSVTVSTSTETKGRQIINETAANRRLDDRIGFQPRVHFRRTKTQRQLTKRQPTVDSREDVSTPVHKDTKTTKRQSTVDVTIVSTPVLKDTKTINETAANR